MWHLIFQSTAEEFSLNFKCCQQQRKKSPQNPKANNKEKNCYHLHLVDKLLKILVPVSLCACLQFIQF